MKNCFLPTYRPYIADVALLAEVTLDVFLRHKVFGGEIPREISSPYMKQVLKPKGRNPCKLWTQCDY